MPEIPPARLPDDELATIHEGWVAGEERNRAYDDAGYQRSGWRSYEHTLLGSLLAHIAWQAVEIDRFRQMALDYQADLERLDREAHSLPAPALTARDLLARLPVLHDPAVTEALAGVGEEEDADA